MQDLGNKLSAVVAEHHQKLLRKVGRFVGVVFLFLLFIASPPQLSAGDIPELNKLITNGGYALNKKGETLFSKNFRSTFIPASTIKLLTCLAALELLGPDFHFSTDIYLDPASTLYIKGYGDPFLVSEKVRSITEKIAALGIKNIKNIILDNSAFALEHEKTEGAGNSTNPYDSSSSALAVNFNTLPLKVVHGAKIKSPEPQTPFIPLMGIVGNGLDSGFHRVNIYAFPQISSISNSLLYCGQLFKTMLEEQGILVKGEIFHGKVPSGAQLLLTYNAEESISDLVESCLFSSNNFMANQLYLAIGVARYGFPATWKKSNLAMNNFIRNNLKLTNDQVTMVEGSGLSIKNRVTPEAMIMILSKFRPYASLIPVKYGVRMKSGTLRESGVFCYAGYFSRGKKIDPFVILLNQKQNGRDKILTILYQQ